MSAHTPGPWRAIGHSIQAGSLEDHSHTTIADAYAPALDVDPEEAEAIATANARLIAAAPEMYAALKLVWDARGLPGDEKLRALNEVARVLDLVEGKNGVKP